jgi:NAD+ kinase
MNTSAYRCFHSSILLPDHDTIRIAGVGRSTGGTIILSFDGRTHEFTNVKYVEISQAPDKEIHLIRQKTYDYWRKLSTKLL